MGKIGLTACGRAATLFNGRRALAASRRRNRVGFLARFAPSAESKSRKNESEKCECEAARFGDCWDDRNAAREAQPRDQGGIYRIPRSGVFADRAETRKQVSFHDKQVRARDRNAPREV